MENRAFWIIIVLIAIGVGFIFLQPAVEDKLAPTLENAWVAVEVGDSGVAEMGPVEIDSGDDFTLHAVVGATARGSGKTVYYTEAKRLILGGEEIPADRLRPWNRNRPVKVRWYTLEGRLPYVVLGSEGISAFKFESFLRSNWPLAWSIPGGIDPANDDHLQSDDSVPRPAFGTQRYRVQLELYQFADDLLPMQVVRSWDVGDLKREVDQFPTVTAQATNGAGEASKWFGLTQLDPPEDASADLMRQIDELAGHRIAFSRLTLLRDLARAAGSSFGDLVWDTIDLAGEASWQSGADPGDLLRVGDRVVVLYQDRGDNGTLDYEDLCFDFVQGLEIRSLGDVFSGEGQAVEIARLNALPTAESSAAGSSAEAGP